MKNIKKFVSFILAVVYPFVFPFSAAAQITGDPRGELNTILEQYALPIIIGILVLSAATALITNMDKIIDKNGDGTRKEGIVNVVWVLFYVVLFVLVVAGVIALLNSRFSLRI